MPGHDHCCCLGHPLTSCDEFQTCFGLPGDPPTAGYSQYDFEVTVFGETFLFPHGPFGHFIGDDVDNCLVAGTVFDEPGTCPAGTQIFMVFDWDEATVVLSGLIPVQWSITWELIPAPISDLCGGGFIDIPWVLDLPGDENQPCSGAGTTARITALAP